MHYMLKFRARGGSLVPQIGALDANPRRFVGRVWDPTLGNPKVGVSGGWRMLEEGQEIPVLHQHLAEYTRHVKEGGLWAANEETASVLGVPYDPTYGGEVEILPPKLASKQK